VSLVEVFRQLEAGTVRRTLSYLTSDGETGRVFSTGWGIVFAEMSALFKF